MINTLQKKNYLTTPWKNGQGVTEQIAISPVTASLSLLDFDYRISSATINGNNSFSQFPGFERILVVIEGSGLLLNHSKLALLTPHHFSGDELIDCQLLEDQNVIDLGIIYDPKKIKVKCEITNHIKVENLHTHFFYFLDREHETLMIEKETASFEDSRCVHFEIIRLN